MNFRLHIVLTAALLSLVSCRKKEVEYNYIVPSPLSAHYYEGFYSGGDVPADGSAEGVKVTFNPSLEKKIGTEGYRLEVSAREVKAEAVDSIGIFYAMQTLRQLRTDEGIRWASIEDRPRFAYRGIHLDASRHFWNVAEVKKILREMSLYKFNNFHWHLTDGGGWRVQIDAYPLLTEIGAWRVEKDWDRWNAMPESRFCTVDTPGAYGGYYTKDDIREVVRYADSLHINIIPEFDMPAHSEAVFAVYPHLNCTGERYGNGEFCPANEDYYEFAETVLSELLELFPSRIINIGGDEARKKAWKACPRCRALMQKEGMKSYDELQCYAISRIQSFLRNKGRIMAGWDEILKNQDLAKDTYVYSYRGQHGGIEAANRGLNAVMTPGEVLYLDWYQAVPAFEKKAMYGYSPLKKMYSFIAQPTSESEALFNQAIIKGSPQNIDTIGFIRPENRDNVVGIQGCTWCEYIPDEERLEYMMFPRLLAVSELAWVDPSKKDWENFKVRVNAQLPALRQRGIRPYDLHDEPEITSSVCENGLTAVSLDCENVSAEVRYTIDGTAPTDSSILYIGPFTVEKRTVVTAAGFLEGKKVTYTHSAEIVPGVELKNWYSYTDVE